jgi:1,4-dihydroxy-2-naphthoate polyprenyltransferase
MSTSKTSLKKFIEIWWMAIRPRTLPAAAAGVITGSALALRDGHFRLPPALIAMVVALLLQIGSNLTNDVMDFEKGADSAPRMGPQRVTQSGLLTPRQVKRGMILVFSLAALLGSTLVFSDGWVVIPIGAAAIIAAVAYTAGPYPLGYHGLGEFFVFIYFGVAAVAGTYFVQAGSVSPSAWLMSLPIGFIIMGILVVNNLRDIQVDKLARKLTLAARFGSRFAKCEYAILLIAAYLGLFIFCTCGLLSWWSMLTWLSLPLAYQTTKIILSQTGKPLNKALAQTGQLALLISLLFLLSIILSQFA